MNDYLIKAYCFNGTARIYAAITTNIAKEAKKIHNLWPTSLAALSRVLTISAIMSTTYKMNERLTIRINGGGPVGDITVEANDGNVRGIIANPGVVLITNDGKQNVAMAVGTEGHINVTKDLRMRDMFTSSSELTTGEIGTDFTNYFAKSEQIPSSVGLGEHIDPDGNMIACGGFLLQVMPGIKDEDIEKLEKSLISLKPIAEMINAGFSPEDIIATITDGNYEILEKKQLSYYCDCNKERFARGLKTLGKTTLTDILETEHHINIKCNFCGKEYDFAEDDVKDLIIDL